jgi:hypothetical protein
MLTLKITKESISEILLGLKSGKAMGYDEIPNEFLKYGGKTSRSGAIFSSITLEKTLYTLDDNVIPL